jgi:hypothetical protein
LTSRDPEQPDPAAVASVVTSLALDDEPGE